MRDKFGTGQPAIPIKNPYEDHAFSPALAETRHCFCNLFLIVLFLIDVNEFVLGL